MGLTESLIFYLLVGAGVSLAVLLNNHQRGAGERAFLAATAVLFWPLYLPVLLRQPEERLAASEVRVLQREPVDEMSAAITQVEAELDTALQSLDGWAEGVLAYEQGRFAELRAAWRLQAARVRQLDRLLDQPEFSAATAQMAEAASQEREHGGDRARRSERVRQQNLQRLREIRRQLYDDLMDTLAWVRELVTMIHLAKFTGAPASRAEELVAQIAAAVEGLSEVTSWRDESLAASP